MRQTSRAVAIAAVCTLITIACGSEGRVGEACDESGVTEGECEAGGVCGKDTTGALFCLKVCSDQAQCASTEDCNGVEGSSLKACRPKGGKK